jgi:hypothetical protein
MRADLAAEGKDGDETQEMIDYPFQMSPSSEGIATFGAGR